MIAMNIDHRTDLDQSRQERHEFNIANTPSPAVGIADAIGCSDAGLTPERVAIHQWIRDLAATGGAPASVQAERDDLKMEIAWLKHCLAIDLRPTLRRYLTGVAVETKDGHLPEYLVDTLVENIGAELHRVIRPTSATLAASPTPEEGEDR
jgi:hypothetical protein